jgi:molybdopterin converting factor small subunit
VEVTVRYFAAAKAAAGRAEERVLVEEGTSLGGLLDRVERGLPDARRAREVIARCSVLRNGESGATADLALRDGDVVDLLPPFAGG